MKKWFFRLHSTTANTEMLRYAFPHRHIRIPGRLRTRPSPNHGIVCEEVNDKGVLRVQIAKRKIWINYKRVKLHVKAEELYPEDYDMSIVFDTVENRKKRHDMERKYTTEVIEYTEND